MHPLIHRAILAASLLSAWPAFADTTTYHFSGLYNIAGGSQAYAGELSITDPVLTSDRPPEAPDIAQPNMAAVWAGTSEFYTGGNSLHLSFASGTQITAASLGIVVNNTTFAGAGSPYPMGLSVQLYPTTFTLTAPTGNVCATPTGACGPDDDPLYHDATQDAIMATTGVYFAFYQAPLSATPGMPDLVSNFPIGHGGLGVHSVQNGLNISTLTTFNSLSATVTAVPEPMSALLLASGLGLLAARKSRRSTMQHANPACLS